MLSALDITIICLGGACVVIYTTIKVLQTIKYRKAVKQAISNGKTEAEAKEYANKLINKPKKVKQNDVNTNDDIYNE